MLSYLIILHPMSCKIVNRNFNTFPFFQSPYCMNDEVEVKSIRTIKVVFVLNRPLMLLIIQCLMLNETPEITTNTWIRSKNLIKLLFRQLLQ